MPPRNLPAVVRLCALGGDADGNVSQRNFSGGRDLDSGGGAVRLLCVLVSLVNPERLSVRAVADVGAAAASAGPAAVAEAAAAAARRAGHRVPAHALVRVADLAAAAIRVEAALANLGCDERSQEKRGHGGGQDQGGVPGGHDGEEVGGRLRACAGCNGAVRCEMAGSWTCSLLTRDLSWRSVWRADVR